jgi:hypothetical protein
VGKEADLDPVRVRDQYVKESSSEGDLLKVGLVNVSVETSVFVAVGVSLELETVHLLTLWVRLTSSVSLPDRLSDIEPKLTDELCEAVAVRVGGRVALFVTDPIVREKLNEKDRTDLVSSSERETVSELGDRVRLSVSVLLNDKLILWVGVNGVRVLVMSNSSEKESLTDAEVVILEPDRLSSSDKDKLAVRVMVGVLVCNASATKASWLKYRPSRNETIQGLE